MAEGQPVWPSAASFIPIRRTASAAVSATRALSGRLRHHRGLGDRRGHGHGGGHQRRRADRGGDRFPGRRPRPAQRPGPRRSRTGPGGHRRAARQPRPGLGPGRGPRARAWPCWTSRCTAATAPIRCARRPRRLRADVERCRDLVQELDDEDTAEQARLAFLGHLSEAAATALARAVSFGRADHDDLAGMAGHLSADTGGCAGRRREIGVRRRAAQRELEAAEQRLQDAENRAGGAVAGHRGVRRPSRRRRDHGRDRRLLPRAGRVLAAAVRPDPGRRAAGRQLPGRGQAGERRGLARRRAGPVDHPARAAPVAARAGARGTSGVPGPSAGRCPVRRMARWPWRPGRGPPEGATVPVRGRGGASPGPAPAAEPDREPGESGAVAYRVPRPLAVPADGEPYKTMVARFELDAATGPPRRPGAGRRGLRAGHRHEHLLAAAAARSGPRVPRPRVRGGDVAGDRGRGRGVRAAARGR